MLMKDVIGLSYNWRYRIFVGEIRKEILRGSYIWLYLEKIILVVLRIGFWNGGWEGDVMDLGGKGNIRSKGVFGVFGWIIGLMVILFINIGKERERSGVGIDRDEDGEFCLVKVLFWEDV